MSSNLKVIKSWEKSAFISQVNEKGWLAGQRWTHACIKGLPSENVSERCWTALRRESHGRIGGRPSEMQRTEAEKRQKRVKIKSDKRTVSDQGWRGVKAIPQRVCKRGKTKWERTDVSSVWICKPESFRQGAREDVQNKESAGRDKPWLWESDYCADLRMCCS